MTSRSGTERVRNTRARLHGLVLACAYVLLLLAPIADAWRVHGAPPHAAIAAAAAARDGATARVGTRSAPVIITAAADDRTCELCALIGAGSRHAVPAVPPSAGSAPLPAVTPLVESAPRTASLPSALGSRAPPLA